MGEKSIWVKLGELDRRVLYWTLFILLAVPFLYPLGLPVSISETTLTLYNYIETLGPNDVAVVGIQAGVSAWPEVLPGLVAVTKHLVSRGVKIIFWGFYTDVDMTMNAIKARVPQLKWANEQVGSGDYKYGVDWVYIGLLAGGEAAVAQLADDLHSIIKADKFGTPADQIPLLQKVHNAADIALVVTSDTGDYGDYYIRQWAVRYKTKVAEVGIAMNYSTFIPYYNAGLAVGALKGVRGGAEYERLIGSLGEGTQRMDALNVSHLLTIFAVLLANICYFMTRGKKGGGG